MLLNSATSLFPNGLANSSGMVGRCFMIHAGHQMFAKFPQRIGQYKAPPGLAITEHYNRTMPDADFACGYSIEVVGPHVVDFAARVSTAPLLGVSIAAHDVRLQLLLGRRHSRCNTSAVREPGQAP